MKNLLQAPQEISRYLLSPNKNNLRSRKVCICMVSPTPSVQGASESPCPEWQRPPPPSEVGGQEEQEAGKAPGVASASMAGKLGWIACQTILIPNINLQTNFQGLETICNFPCFWPTLPFLWFDFLKEVFLPFKNCAYSLEKYWRFR